MSEFDLINQYFKPACTSRNDVVLGIGDDCALLSPVAGKQLAVSTDTLIAGVHFPENTQAVDIGYKSLAVNLSDLAAMGADPAWVSLAISLPEENHQWLQEFMQGFSLLANSHDISLIGGDTTHGPLSVTISVTGYIEPDKALKRSRAKVGDLIYTTGFIGDAAAGLSLVLNDIQPQSYSQYLIERLNRPTPRIAAGQVLKKYSVAAIDVSDGLLADLGHICKASNAGAEINLHNIPLSKELTGYYREKPEWHKILNAGDDYELCFTCPVESENMMLADMQAIDMSVSKIGRVISKRGISCLLNNEILDIQPSGYNHFQNEK